MADQQQRATSSYEPANELIEQLRQQYAEVAKGIADLGDHVDQVERDAEEARMNDSSAQASREMALDELTEWRELLEDYRRGIVDRRELLEKTVGHG